jgi:glycerol-3-phosphate acyltransferase PlsY
MLTSYLVALVVGYLLGSIPFGLVLTRLAGTQDIRQIGSGSIGATNVLRTGRKGLAAATLLGDALKGAVAVLLLRWWCGPECALIAGAGAFLGHLFPVWLGFKGGKGVATYLGVLIVVSFPIALVFGAVWLAIAGLTRYSSAASLTACAAVPACFWYIGAPREALTFLVLAVLSLIMHRGNIARLMAGTESKIGQKAEAPTNP